MNNIIKAVLVTAVSLASTSAFATGTIRCNAKDDRGTPVTVSATYSYSSASIVSDVRVAVGKAGHESLIIEHPQEDIVGQYLDPTNDLLLLRVMDDQIMNTLVRIQTGKSLAKSARVFEVSAPQFEVSTADFTCQSDWE